MNEKSNVNDRVVSLEGVEVPEHHRAPLMALGLKARKEYFRSVRAGLTSVGALAYAESVERATVAKPLGTKVASRRFTTPHKSNP